MKAFVKRNLTGGKYIFSGLFKTLVLTVSGFIILRWLEPEELGRWQSITVFVSYIQILTLGTTSGLNRELPFWLGKGDQELALKRLKGAGFFTTALSLAIMVLVTLVSILLYLGKLLSLDMVIMLIFAFSIGALSIQTNFIGATFRSTQSFSKLTSLQMYNAALYVLLLPLVYFFDIWGYIAYQVLLALVLYGGYWLFRPYKIGYKYDVEQIKELVKIGFPIYFWNYLAQISRSIPRLFLVIFGSPLLVGLYSPAGSINAAILNLPNYTNRFLFPQMAYKFGQSNDPKVVYDYAIKASKLLFLFMLIGATALAFIIPPVFEAYFPKYVGGILAAQITVFSGVFYSINALLHNALNSIKSFRSFKYIVGYRLVFICLFAYVASIFFKDTLVVVSVAAVLSEFFNLFNYLYFFRKAALT
jgi:O-antigen/teichoic acid export membrane protein